MREDLELAEKAAKQGWKVYEDRGPLNKKVYDKDSLVTGYSLTFEKGRSYVWRVRAGWVRADLIFCAEGTEWFKGHKIFDNLKTALGLK